MYLSRLILNPRNRRVQSELARPYELHRTVYSSFPPCLCERERVLYRLENDAWRGQIQLLVQSQIAPDWSWADGSPGYLIAGAAVEVKQFELSLEREQVLAFRLRANPTVKKKSHEDGKEPPKNGIRIGLAREEDQRAWLDRKGAQHGYRPIQVRIMPEGMQKSRSSREKGGRALAHLSVRYEGLLQVTDPGRLEAAIRGGVGAAKGFGFGLLSLAPPPRI